MSKENIRDKILFIISEKVHRKLCVTPSMNLRELGLNSISFIEIVLELELEFDIEYPDSMLYIDATEKIEDLVQVVYELLESKQ